MGDIRTASRGSIVTILAVLTVAGCTAKPDVQLAVPSLTADDFVAEFQKDATAADAKYKDRFVDVSGVILDADGGDSDGRTFICLTPVELKKSFVLYGFNPKDREAAWRLVEGQSIRLRGKCAGGSPGVLVLDCQILEAGPSPAVNVSAQQLSRDYQAGAGDPKYKGKPIFIDGVVQEVDTVYDTLLLENAGSKKENLPPIIAAIGGTQRTFLRELKKGQKILVRGVCDSLQTEGEFNKKKIPRYVNVVKATVVLR